MLDLNNKPELNKLISLSLNKTTNYLRFNDRDFKQICIIVSYDIHDSKLSLNQLANTISNKITHTMQDIEDIVNDEELQFEYKYGELETIIKRIILDFDSEQRGKRDIENPHYRNLIVSIMSQIIEY